MIILFKMTACYALTVILKVNSDLEKVLFKCFFLFLISILIEFYNKFDLKKFSLDERNKFLKCEFLFCIKPRSRIKFILSLVPKVFETKESNYFLNFF